MYFSLSTHLLDFYHFYADPSKTDVLEKLKNEEIQLQGTRRSRISPSSIVLLCNEGVDLEIEW
jgi:hypothetical protein